jgi:hypothetical protein
MNGGMSLTLIVFGKEQAAAAKPLWLYLDKDKSDRGHQDISEHFSLCYPGELFALCH